MPWKLNSSLLPVRASLLHLERSPPTSPNIIIFIRSDRSISSIHQPTVHLSSQEKTDQIERAHIILLIITLLTFSFICCQLTQLHSPLPSLFIPPFLHISLTSSFNSHPNLLIPLSDTLLSQRLISKTHFRTRVEHRPFKSSVQNGVTNLTLTWHTSSSNSYPSFSKSTISHDQTSHICYPVPHFLLLLFLAFEIPINSFRTLIDGQCDLKVLFQLVSAYWQ